jgi:hypothetical protein
MERPGTDEEIESYRWAIRVFLETQTLGCEPLQPLAADHPSNSQQAAAQQQHRGRLGH